MLCYDLRQLTDPHETWGWMAVQIVCGCGDPDCLGVAFEIVPKWDLRGHTCGDGQTEPCWCEPQLDEAGRQIIHNSLDGREAFERGERRVS